MNTAVLLLLARKGVVAAISQFLIAHNGSVLHSDDHLDSGRDLFLSRLEWDLDGFDIPISDFEHAFRPVADRFLIKYHLALTDYRPRSLFWFPIMTSLAAPANWRETSLRSSAIIRLPSR
jgi:formyltetrahydrofolate deformylase